MLKRMLLIGSVILLAAAGTLSAQGRGRPGPWTGPGLTEDQRGQVWELVNAMREDGATREEIHSAVADLLAGWGIDRPDRPGPGFGHPGEPPFAAQLTEEQRQEVFELVSRLREDGATREEIRTAVTELLADWGIDVPEFPRFRWGYRGQPPFFDQLTEDQRLQVRDLVHQLRSEGSSREQIHAAVAALLEEWGIELPPGGPDGRNLDRPRIRAGNHPNPFNPATRISYTLSTPATVRVQIFNLAGQVVRSYYQGYQPAGSYSVMWNGDLDDGQPAPSGVYFYRIEAGNATLTQRMLLMK